MPFFFFHWHYNLLWVLAFSLILLLSALPLHCFLHPFIPIICMPSSISTILLFRGLPLILVPVGFHSKIRWMPLLSVVVVIICSSIVILTLKWAVFRLCRCCIQWEMDVPVTYFPQMRGSLLLHRSKTIRELPQNWATQLTTDTCDSETDEFDVYWTVHHCDNWRIETN